MKLLSTDVLVLGSGLTGLRAALACRERGLNVMVCSKNSPGLGNCTTVSQGAFSTSGEGFSPDDHRESTLAAGHQLNEESKVDLLVNRAEDSVKSLQKYGVKLQERSRGLNSVSRGIGREGISIMQPLVDYARELGVEFISPFFAWDIIETDGSAAGVWGFVKNERDPTIICAKAIVLAAGGGGALYSRTDNPPGITGDGYAMAYRAGLPLMDMEFVQFYPLSTAYKDKPGRFLPPVAAEVGDFLNARQENIVDKYGIVRRPLAIASRDTLSRAMALEVFHRRGIDGAVRLDLRNFEARWQGSAGRSDNDRLKNWFEGLLDGRDSLLVMPVSHFFMGGVVTDDSCQAELPGLFAAGEVVGGLHGANRLGGNALSETAVFGEISGREAAAYAEGRNSDRLLSVEGKVRDGLRYLFAEKGGKEELDAKTLKRKIQVLMWEHAGLIRSEDSLIKAGEELETYKDLSCSRVKAGSISAFLELKNMLLVAEMVVESALLRKESRGSHYRIDYPEAGDDWLKHIVLQQKNGGMNLKIT